MVTLLQSQQSEYFTREIALGSPLSCNTQGEQSGRYYEDWVQIN
jgi:hypothetical protein